MNPNNLHLVESFIQSHSIEAAREIESQEVSVAVDLFSLLPLNHGRKLFYHMLPTCAARMCEALATDKAIMLIGENDADHIASILRSVSKAKRTSILKGLSEKKSALCRLRLSYSEDIVGGWMAVDILVLPENISVGDALKRFSLVNYEVDWNTIPVVDNSNSILGTVNFQDLIRAKKAAKINDFINDAPACLSSRASLTSCLRHPGWDHHDTLPVLNRNRHLIGLLKHVDLRRGIKSYSDENTAKDETNIVFEVGSAYIGSVAELMNAFSGNRPTTSLSEKNL